MQGRWMYVGVGLLAVLMLFFFYKKYKIAPDIDFPAMELNDLEDNKVTLSRYRGKPLVLNFAASWCGPCMKELSALEKVKAEVEAATQIVVVSDESTERIRKMQAQHGFSFEFLKLRGSFGAIGIHSIPTSYLIDSEGKVVKKEVGYMDWGDASNRKHLLKLLGQ